MSERRKVLRLADLSQTLLQRALARRNRGRPPVWFMRQAGRYHRHYQRLRTRHDFMDLCKRPDLAVEVTLGPIEDFGFDAAILFSDLLFPLEAMGMGLRYEPGPKLDWHLKSTADLARLRGGAARATQMSFQAEAIARLRARLPSDCSLIGFVGGPFTLYAYAAAGSHEGFARDGLAGLDNGLYAGFTERLRDLLAANMALQAEAGADCVAIFDTAAGTLAPDRFAQLAAPALAAVVQQFRARCPETPLIYYSRDTGPDALGGAARHRSAVSRDRLAARSRRDAARAVRSLERAGQYRSAVVDVAAARAGGALARPVRARAGPARAACERRGSAASGTACCSTRRRTMYGWP